MEILSNGAVLAIIIGLIEVAKRVGLPKQFIPVVALVLGLGLTFGIGGFNITMVLNGLAIGLSSLGLFSGVKATVGR